MNTPKAILIGFALVAAAVYFSRDVGPARAASGEPNFQIPSITSDGSTFFKLNVDTGKDAYCVRRLNISQALAGADGVMTATIVCSKFQ